MVYNKIRYYNMCFFRKKVLKQTLKFNKQASLDHNNKIIVKCQQTVKANALY